MGFVDHNSGMSQQCDINAKKANAIVDHINRSIGHRVRKASTPGCSALAGPSWRGLFHSGAATELEASTQSEVSF